jgi:hypothetical protein
MQDELRLTHHPQPDGDTRCYEPEDGTTMTNSQRSAVTVPDKNKRYYELLRRPFGLCGRALAAFLLFLASIPAYAQTDIVYVVDFTDYDRGSVRDWLVGKGFTFKADADNRRKIDLDINQNGLMIEAKKKARALLTNDRADITDVGNIRITWGVERYPEGANYDNGVRNEALMVMVFFGRDRIESGSLLIPDSPFFIGLFLCHEGSVSKAHIGRYFQKGGRYICLDQPKEGELIVSEFDLASAFKQYFDLDAVSAVSGIIVQADTTGLNNDRGSRATIRLIEFLRPTP